jgi:uncharacterized protein YceK
MTMNPTLLAVLVVLSGCASRRTDSAATPPSRPTGSARNAADTADGYRLRDTIPDTTVAGRRDTTTQR